MDIGKLVKDINGLNEYVTVTQDATEKCKTSRIQLNMTTVLALKKIRSLEIEHVNKCEENGIACVIFERMLCLPPSKTWGVLSKEMVTLLQYWLDAVRKHLVKHSPHWWTFLKLLLRFLKEIRQKDSSMPNILVELTAECLLDLATTDRPDAMQRYEILHCFNMYCSESSREIRFALRTKFGQYFTKLAAYMGSCGNLPTQYSIMETLLRWLLPRQDRTLRIASATKWFPARLYAESVVDIFLERPWMNFFQDARDFLNAHNERSGLITSVICRKVSVGDIVIISDMDKMDSWLDINSASKCISVLLDPRVLDVFGCTNHKSFETFVVSEDNTHTTKLYRDSEQLLLSIQTITPPRVLPSCIKLGDDVSCNVTVVVTTHCDVKRLDGALRKIFDEKYQLLLDLDKELTPSPPRVRSQTSKNNASEEDTRFSHPVEVRRRKHSGYMIKSKRPLSCLSPSTASTSSLAQLHEKLAALPRYKFDKEPQSVCALPELSVVSEASETDDRNNSTLKCRPYGVCHKNLNTLDCNRKSQSDNETSRRDPEVSRKGKCRQLSPVLHEDRTSCLLVATVGSAEDSVINDTVEKLSKSKDYNPDNIVDLLVKEALESKPENKKDKYDSGISGTGDKRSPGLSENCDAIENTPNAEINFINTKIAKVKSKVVSSTSDDSNTEAINYTSNDFVTRRNKRQSFDVQDVEEFFSQHFAENKAGEVIISPSLAKKINETSSDASDNGLEVSFIFMEDDLEDVEPCDFHNIEVLECLNSIVDRVCDDFDKCTKYLQVKQDSAAVDNNSGVENNLHVQDIVNPIQDVYTNPEAIEKPALPNEITLKYRVGPKINKRKSRSNKRKNKLEKENASKMSTIIEDNGEIAAECNPITVAEEDAKTNNKQSLPDDTREDNTTPMLRRKRKLYSPKDEQMTKEVVHCPPQDSDFENEEAQKTNETPTTTPTYKPYKELENERKRRIRMPRNRRSRKTDTPSPRSKRMNDLFNKVKDSADSEKVILADRTSNLGVFNYSSDSDDDFKVKKIEVSRKVSSTTLGSEDSTVTKRGRVVKRITYNSNNIGRSNATRKRIRSQKKKTEFNIEPVQDLIDERMRENKNELDTSIIDANPRVVLEKLELNLPNPPEMELIKEKDDTFNEAPQKTSRRKNKAKTGDLVKGAKKSLINSKLDDDRTESPLPCLVVEEAPTTNKEDGDLSANIIDKFMKICQNPDKYINESNTTQNMLSDNERTDSPVIVVITAESLQVECENESIPEQSPAEFAQRAPEISEAANTQGSGSTGTSMSTAGITGHGDSAEPPPTPTLIEEKYQHRNLQTEYSNNSTKKYFEILMGAVNDMNDASTTKSNAKKVCATYSTGGNLNEVDIKTDISSSTHSLPASIVSLERMSLEDINRWLPSAKDLQSDAGTHINRRTTRSSNSVKNNNETCKISKEEPEVRRSERLSSKKSVTYVFSDSDDVSEFNYCADEIDQPSIEVNCKPKSIISPIQLFEDVIANAETLSQTTQSEGDKYLSEIKETLSKKNEYSSPQRIHEEMSIQEQASTKSNESPIFDKTILQKLAETANFPSGVTMISVDASKMLKRRLEEDRDSYKKMRVGDNNNLGDVASTRDASVCSLDEWFARSEHASSAAEEITLSLKETMQIHLEKLDTTLREIHLGTSTKFVHLFVWAQQELDELRTQRKMMCKQLAGNVLTTVYTLLDEAFSDLNRRTLDQDNTFMMQLKEKCSAVIREECQQKRTMVQLLKEDVQAVIEHNRKKGQQ